jgi:hypothetical protein
MPPSRRSPPSAEGRCPEPLHFSVPSKQKDFIPLDGESILRCLIARPVVLRAFIIRPPARRAFHALALLALLVGGAARAEDLYTDMDRADALTCRMLLWVTRAGVVQAAQVVRSGGTSTVDEMCLNGVIARRLKSPSRDGSSAGAWVTFTLGLMMKLPHKVALAAQVRPELPIPALAHDRPLELNRFLDGAADTTATHRVCPACPSLC